MDSTFFEDSSSGEEINKNVLYQKLPSDIIASSEKCPKSENLGTIKEYLLNVLPSCDTRKIDTDLKNYISINCKRRTIKKDVRPRGKKKPLSKTELRKLGLYRVPKTAVSYAEAIAMNKLWESYMMTNLNLNVLRKQSWHGVYTNSSWNSINSSLLKADYHGAHIKVIASKNHSLVGHTGIVIFDTKYTFQLVEIDNTVKTIPKEPCIFEFSLVKFKFKIFGKYFCIRNCERPTKKIKSILFPVL